MRPASTSGKLVDSTGHDVVLPGAPRAGQRSGDDASVGARELNAIGNRVVCFEPFVALDGAAQATAHLRASLKRT